MVTSKSAIGEVDVSEGMIEGGSSAQPWPGTHGRIGKNDPSLIASPFWEMRSRRCWGSVSRNGIATDTVPPAATARRTSSVVGSASRERARWPSTVTAPVVRRDPCERSAGPFAHSRNTSSLVAMSGVKATRRKPVTVCDAGSMARCSW